MLCVLTRYGSRTSFEMRLYQVAEILAVATRAVGNAHVCTRDVIAPFHSYPSSHAYTGGLKLMVDG